jgi:hypothetical protein
MAWPRPEKSKPEPSPTRRLLPMELQIGERLADETGEWEIISRPYTSVAGKLASVHVRKIGQPRSRTFGRGARMSGSR